MSVTSKLKNFFDVGGKKRRRAKASKKKKRTPPRKANGEFRRRR